MKRKLAIEIECLGTLCATSVAGGRWCPHLGSKRFGTVFLCRLLPSGDKPYTVLTDTNGDGTGWLQRCQACLSAEDRKAPNSQNTDGGADGG